jgi:ferredoxin, 2Fe-2S
MMKFLYFGVHYSRGFSRTSKSILHFTITFAPVEQKIERMYKVKFKFEQKGMEPVILENVEPGQSLLEIALGNDIELHHNCGGVCACTTCHLYIEKGMEYIDEISDKEEDFIDRAANPRLNSRLGCQSLLNDGEGEIEVTLPDQTQFLGE